MKLGHIFNIMIGSPSDVSEIAQKAIDCIHQWNTINSDDRNIALVPHHWTSSSYPSLSNSAQKVLNSQLVEKSDALVAIFGSRIGTPTDEHISGTVEEIEEHRKAGKPVMVFFCDQISANSDMDQIVKLSEFRKNLEGLYEMFGSIEDFEKKFINKLHLLVQNELKSRIEPHPLIESSQSISFSEQEIDLMHKWTKSRSNYFSKIAFMGGAVLFSFSGMGVETKSAKEEAEMDDFINRLIRGGYLEHDGFTKQGKPKYKLTLTAFEKFGQE